MSHNATITLDVDVSLDDFDLEDIADYLRDNGYECTQTDLVEHERYPDRVKPFDEYVKEFCKLNNLHFT